jgi:5-formyltetrahydrofolate cyclo-ligase
VATSPESTADLRSRLRSERLAVEPRLASIASEQAVARLLDLPEIQAARRVALYLACDGELSPKLAILQLLRAGQLVAAPRFESREMTFADLGEETRAGRFGIQEPLGNAVSITELDVVVAPLVAVDGRGVRLGRGAGYYDSALSHLLTESRPAEPFVVGFAYDLQLVDDLKREPHDVPLDALVTPSMLRRFQHGRA